ncbi:MAG: DUF4114 domain-containing protein [Rhizobiales bacterium]|nr:DUF4114 domain-containing protein [Hyphomicrobiales bacterium]
MSVDTDMNISPVIGTSADDILVGTGRSEVLYGGAGDDIITALSGNDEVFGGSGNDTLYGQGGNDILYGNGRPSFVNMSNLTMVEATTATVTFVDEGAGYRNALGVYEIDEDGTLSAVKILFPNASKFGSGGELVPGVSAVQFAVSTGAQLGFFVVSNGYGKGYENQEALSGADGSYELRDANGDPGTINSASVTLWYVEAESGTEYQVKSQYGYDIFHSYGNETNGYALNPDNYLHVVGRANAVSGEILIGFEDLYNGGDNDYDDTVITVNIGQTNVVGVLPVSTSAGNLPDDDILYGGDNNDILYGIGGDDILHGGSGNDELFGNSGNDVLYGNDNNDILTGNSGNDILYGGDHNDELFGNSGDDYLSGDGGNDTLSGGSGNDQLFGGSGNDTLSAGSGNDILNGGSGNDILNGNSGDDNLSGSSGADTLNGHSGNDILQGEGGSDRLVGGGGNDILDGGEHNDKLYGGSGNDILFGGEGNDYFNGGSGNDIIEGGLGNDKMIGGSGSDIFVFDAALGSTGNDKIGGFTLDDFLSFSNYDFTTYDEFCGCMTMSGSNTIIDFDSYGKLTLNNFNMDDFNEDMIIFV